MFKFIAVFVVLVVAAGALWWTGLLTKWIPSVPPPSAFMGETANTQATSTPQTQNPTATNDLPTAEDNTSDEAITEDTAAIDAELNALGTDSANAQGSLDDKPVTQEY